MPDNHAAKLSRRMRIGRIWATIWRGLVKYDETDGEQRAASFAYYALFALLPLMVLLITLGSRFLGNREQATNEVFRLMAEYTAVDLASSQTIRPTVESFMQSRLGSGLVSAVVVVWCALRFFQALVHGVNKAWGTKEYTRCRLPLKNLSLITILDSLRAIGIHASSHINRLQVYYRSRIPVSVV